MTDSITLYHVSFDVQDELVKRFEPRVPEDRMNGEDEATPRVCLCDSVTGCFSAMPDRLDCNKEGVVKVVVWEHVFDVSDPSLVLWRELYEKGSVPDAALTHECWYLGLVEMQGTVYELSDLPLALASRKDELIIKPCYREPVLRELRSLGVFDPSFDTLDICTIVNRWLPENLPCDCDRLQERIEDVMRIPAPGFDVDAEMRRWVFKEEPRAPMIIDAETQRVFKAMPMRKVDS